MLIHQKECYEGGRALCMLIVFTSVMADFCIKDNLKGSYLKAEI